MKTRTLSAYFVLAAWAGGFAACSIGVSGGARVSPDGKYAILQGEDSIYVKAKQPPAPVPPPPPPKPRRIMKAKVVDQKIEITEKVMFDIDKATIKEESHGLLRDVGLVLSKHPDIEKIRIEGHTDSDGSDAYNKTLSQKRAAAVKEFLIAAGIEDARLEAVGYGEERPLATNDNTVGKEQNRRVEFNILARGTPLRSSSEKASPKKLGVESVSFEAGAQTKSSDAPKSKEKMPEEAE